MLYTARLCLLFLLLSGAAPAQVPAPLVVKRYGTREGLASDDVRGIVRDGRGFLWVLTPEGASRFDGVSFKNYPRPVSAQRAVHNRMWCTGYRGTVYVAGYTALLAHDVEGDAFRRVADWADPGVTNKRYPFVMADTLHRCLWLRSGTRLYRYDEPTKRLQRASVSLPEAIGQGVLLAASHGWFLPICSETCWCFR